MGRDPLARGAYTTDLAAAAAKGAYVETAAIAATIGRGDAQ